MKKKLVLIFFVGLFVACGSLFAINKVRAVTADTTGPTVNSISIAKHDFNPGDVAPVSLDIEDDISGVKWVRLSYVETTSYRIVDISLNGSNGAWSFQVPSNMTAGTYRLEAVEAMDGANNHTLCSTHEVNTNAKFQLLSWDMNLIVAGSQVETVPPVISDVSVDKTELKPGEVARFRAKVVDDGSSVKSVSATLNEIGQTERIFRPVNVSMYFNKETGYYEGTFTASNVNKSYELYSMHAYDIFDNQSVYTPAGVYQSSCLSSSYNFCTLPSLTIKVTSPVVDSVAPVIEKIYFSKDKVSAPSTIKAYIKASDDVSGLFGKASLIVQRQLDDGTFATNSSLGAYLSDNMTYNATTGLYEGEFNINQYNPAGKYTVYSVKVVDNSSNETELKSTTLPGGPVSFQIVESLSVDLVTGTTAKDIVKKIQDAADYATIMIDSTKNPTITKTIFDAIKGTNKKIYVETAGIQWVFNGKDIGETKDINVNTTISMLSNTDTYNISEILDKAIVISFAENGELPGKALIRLKADYAFRNYIGIEDLLVYYYDNTNKVFVEVKLAATLSEDGFYEFYIDHNSTFVITNKAPAAKYVSTKVADLALNDKKVKVPTSEVVAEKLSDYTEYIFYVIFGVLAVLITITVIVIRKKGSKKTSKTKVGAGTSPDTTGSNDEPIDAVEKELDSSDTDSDMMQDDATSDQDEPEQKKE